MLRRLENVSVEFRKSLFGSKGWAWIHVGRKSYRGGTRITQEAYADACRQQCVRPYSLITVGDRTYWWFQDRFYWDNDYLSGDEVYALLTTRQPMRTQR
jgi:hypothetical protein